MSKLTRLFIDAANENVDALPRRLADLGVRYPKEREEEFRAELRELYYRYYGASLAEIDPLQVIREAFAADLLDEPAPADALRAARQGDRDARLGRRRALPGLQRLRGREAVRARPAARAVHAAARWRAQRGARRRCSSAQVALELPYQVHDVLEELRDGQIEVGFVHKGLDDFMHRLDVVFNRLVVALVVAGGLIGSSLIGIFATSGPQLLGVNVHLGRRLRRSPGCSASGCSGASSAAAGCSTADLRRGTAESNGCKDSSRSCANGHWCGGAT